MNRAERRRAAKCKHPYLLTKEWADGRSHRWCESCGFEEWIPAPEETDV